jgi:hypothetical protein
MSRIRRTASVRAEFHPRAITQVVGEGRDDPVSLVDPGQDLDLARAADPDLEFATVGVASPVDYVDGIALDGARRQEQGVLGEPTTTLTSTVMPIRSGVVYGSTRRTR